MITFQVQRKYFICYGIVWITLKVKQIQIHHITARYRT